MTFQAQIYWEDQNWLNWIQKKRLLILNFALPLHSYSANHKRIWTITLKLHFENINLFLKKRTYTHARTPLPLFVFVRFSRIPPPLLNECTFWMPPNKKVNNNKNSSSNRKREILSRTKKEMLWLFIITREFKFKLLHPA